MNRPVPPFGQGVTLNKRISKELEDNEKLLNEAYVQQSTNQFTESYE
jgi:hypothetical protein